MRPPFQNRQQGSLTFTDPRLCAAIVERLTFAGNIIETGPGSCRLAHALAIRNGTDNRLRTPNGGSE